MKIDRRGRIYLTATERRTLHSGGEPAKLLRMRTVFMLNDLEARNGARRLASTQRKIHLLHLQSIRSWTHSAD